jgi:hypothetical protein
VRQRSTVTNSAGTAHYMAETVLPDLWIAVGATSFVQRCSMYKVRSARHLVGNCREHASPELRPSALILTLPDHLCRHQMNPWDAITFKNEPTRQRCVLGQAIHGEAE